jgi:PAS domain S-box-containing protein
MITMQQVKRTILIVKESPVEREVYRSYLDRETNFTYEFWEAESTEIALRLCGSQLPDCIVLDYLLPDRNGLDLMTELKTYTGENCPPVIMLNDRGNEAIAIQAFKTGVEDYLLESEITAETFCCVTRTAIENFRLRQQLRESEERYRAIVEDQTELICRFLPDCTLKFVNGAYSRYFDSTPTELIGQNFLNLIPESHHSKMRQQIAEFSEATSENAVTIHEHPVIKPNGEIGWQQWTNRAIFNSNGEIIEFQAVGRDISARKQAEIALSEREQRYHAIFDTTYQFMGLLTPDGILIEANQTALDFGGLTRDEVLNRPFWETRWWTISEAVQTQLKNAIARAAGGEFVRYEVEVLGVGNSTTTIDFSLKPVCDKSGQVVLLIPEGRDISDRLRYEGDRNNIQTELNKSQARLNLAMQSARTGFWDLNLITKEAIWSNQCKQLLGLSEDWQETNYQVLLTRLHPDDRQKLDRAIELSIESGFHEIEFRVVWDDGSIHWLDNKGRVFYNDTGQAERMSGISTDITERKETELALQKANERFELAAAVNCSIYDYDLEKNTVERSPGLTKLFGYSPSEIEPTAEWWYERIHPSQRETIQETEKAALLGEETSIRLEYQVRHRDGYYIWVRDRAFIVRDESGRALRIVGNTTDISDRKLIEQRLRESEERLQIGVRVAGVALARFDYASNTVELSPEAAVLYGFSADELIVTRDRIHDTFHPEERELMEQIIQQVLDPNGDGWFEREHRVVWSNGAVRWLQVRKQVFFERSGDNPRPSYAILAAIDITDRIQAERERERLLAEAQAAREEAEAANRDKDEFVAVIAHELRSPINSVAGWVQLLRTRQFDRATTNRAYEAIERGTQTQVQLIEDLLDISRIACGTLRLTFAPVDLTKVIEAALNLVRPMADSKQVHLEIQLTEIIQVSGDENRLQQIVVNLLTNAIKFTPSMGRVTTVLELVERQARITVSDTGQGISPEFLPNIFERFQQAQKNSGSKGGLGLGLAIVKNLVELHNGTITADSLGIGEGATFAVWLPLMETESVISNKEISIASDESPLAGIRILAVDDEPDSLELLQFILENAGAEVQTANSGSVALEVLKQFNPNLLVRDISMPDLNGHELLQQIRTIYPERQILAIALTAYASSSDRDYARRMGFEKYFSKPIEPEVLVRAIVNLLV